MKGKTKGKCPRCQIVYRWLRSFGRVAAMRCPRCKGQLEATPWGFAKMIECGYQLIDTRPEPTTVARRE